MSIYMFYFGKRGGGIPQQPVPFEAPNDWRIAGTATVSADGRTITTDPVSRRATPSSFIDKRSSHTSGGDRKPTFARKWCARS